MKKLFALVFSIFSLIPFATKSQNYQCLQSGVNRYFINDNGYLRGIRIDSMQTFTDKVVYYPYHTPRGTGSYLRVSLDSTGGSWLGKKVKQLSNGTFIFDNNWGDSVIIKTQASIDDSWIFYSDTSSLFYRAKVIATDTMTISGTVDSIKKILITANNTSGIVMTDPVDSFEIFLSKNHGFAQIFDLYTFPFHKPDSSYREGIDYYLDQSLNILGTPYSLIHLPHSDFNLLIFKQVALINPTHEQLYDWNVGDVYEYAVCYGDAQWSSPSCNPAEDYLLDTITGKTIAPDAVSYNYSGVMSHVSPMSLFYSEGEDYTYYPSPTTSIARYDTSILITMPEEYHQTAIYYYFPNDTSFCMNSPLYTLCNNSLVGLAYYPPFEGPFTTEIDKLKLGVVHYYSVGMDSGFLVKDKTLLYYYRNGEACGNYDNLSLGVAAINTGKSVVIFPNPANNDLIVKTYNSLPHTVTIVDAMGQNVKTIITSQTQELINTSNMPDGIYNVSVTGENGERTNNKVVIVH